MMVMVMMLLNGDYVEFDYDEGNDDDDDDDRYDDF